MDPNRMINMVINTVMRRLINLGVSKGFDMASGKGPTAEPLTPEQKTQAKAGQEMSKKARQGAKLARRIGKF